MSGLLVGILAARTISGVVGNHLGGRAMYHRRRSYDRAHPRRPDDPAQILTFSCGSFPSQAPALPGRTVSHGAAAQALGSVRGHDVRRIQCILDEPGVSPLAYPFGNGSEGVILLNLGVQCSHVSNQARIYGLRPEARNWLNAIYMVTFFCGATIGSFGGSHSWSRWGWSGVCAVGSAFLVIALAAFRATSEDQPLSAAGTSTSSGDSL